MSTPPDETAGHLTTLRDALTPPVEAAVFPFAQLTKMALTISAVIAANIHQRPRQKLWFQYTFEDGECVRKHIMPESITFTQHDDLRGSAWFLIGQDLLNNRRTIRLRLSGIDPASLQPLPYVPMETPPPGRHEHSTFTQCDPSCPGWDGSGPS